LNLTTSDRSKELGESKQQNVMMIGWQESGPKICGNAVQHTQTTTLQMCAESLSDSTNFPLILKIMCIDILDSCLPVNAKLYSRVWNQVSSLCKAASWCNRNLIVIYSVIFLWNFNFSVYLWDFRVLTNYVRFHADSVCEVSSMVSNIGQYEADNCRNGWRFPQW